MVKIVIDTNAYLNFYRSKNESLEVLAKVKKVDSNLLFPTIIFDEFLRCRNANLQQLIDLYDKVSINIYPSALVQNLSNFKKLINIRNNFEKNIKTIKQELIEIKNDPNKDKIYGYVKDIFESSQVIKIDYDDEIIELAQKRHLLGKPPGSDKVNICDEIIWECLLKKSESDIIIVTNDKSFLTYKDYLKDEFNRNTDHELKGITEKIIDAFKLIKIIVGEKLEKIENDMQRYLREREEAEQSHAIASERAVIRRILEGEHPPDIYLDRGFSSAAGTLGPDGRNRK